MSDKNEDIRATLLMSKSMGAFAQDISVRAKNLFGSPNNGLPAKADPQVLKNDQAAFRNASLWAFGAGIASVAGMSYIGRKWHLAYRIPAVSFVGFTCFGAANLYFTKNAIEGLLHDVEHESATAQVLCPSMRQLQPCLDDYRCKEIMGRDFGGKTVLEWLAACKRREALRGTSSYGDSNSSSSSSGSSLDEQGDDFALDADPWKDSTNGSFGDSQSPSK